MKKKQIGVTLAAFILMLLVLGTGTKANALDTQNMSNGPVLASMWEEVGQPETGLIVFEGIYNYPLKDGDGNVIMWREANAYGLKDSNGNVVLPCEYGGFQYADGIILAVHREPTIHFCAYDKTGHILFEDTEVTGISLDKNSGMFEVRYSQHNGAGHPVYDYYMYDRNFNPVTKDYEIYSSLGDDYYKAEKDGKFGIYKLNVGLVIPCQYQDISYIGSDLFSAAKDEQYYQGAIDLNNNQVLPFNFDYIASYLDGFFLVGKFSDREASVRALNTAGWQTWMTDPGGSTLFGVADSSGKVVVPLEYENLSLSNENGQLVARVGEWTGEWLAYWADGSGVGRIYKYAYSIEISSASVPAQPSLAAATGFADVSSAAYYASAVTWAVGQGITNGTSANKFSPEETCSNAQILTFLWRACGEPEPAIGNPYSNVAESDYYYKAARWAYEKGMVSGTTFDADKPCTRAMTVTYIWQSAGSPAAASAVSFTDVPASASYAAAVAWAVNQGITNGDGANTFSPDKTCTRGQIVTFLYRAFA